LFGAIAKLASINLLKFGSFSYWFDKPWFHTEGRLDAVLITPSLGVSNWAVIYNTPTLTPHHQLATLIAHCASSVPHPKRSEHNFMITSPCHIH
jgi:hypothetical protein